MSKALSPATSSPQKPYEAFPKPQNSSERAYKQFVAAVKHRDSLQPPNQPRPISPVPKYLEETKIDIKEFLQDNST